jgi:YD repeat-containing protein
MYDFNKQIVASCFLIASSVYSIPVISQNMLPGRNDLYKYKISKVVADNYTVLGKKSKKNYTDTVSFDIFYNVKEKKIIAFDTASERKLQGQWNYTYDTLGNRLLETRKSPGQAVMDYFNYVYDSGRIKKQIWVYWVNMKLAFSKIYEVKYDGNGRLAIEKVEEGPEKLDSIFSFRYDTNGRLTSILCSSDKDFGDTINIATYFYYPNGNTAKIVTTSKNSTLTEKFYYDENRRLKETDSGDESTTYEYDSNGLLASSEITSKNKSIPDTKFTYSYIYK